MTVISKRTKTQIYRDLMDLARLPRNKTYLYRHSNLDWYNFIDIFNRLLENNWIELVGDKGGVGDSYCITKIGKIYRDNISKIIDSIN